jgi:hypothetical protein
VAPTPTPSGVPAVGHSTDFIRAVAQQEALRSARGLKVALVAVTVLLGVAIAALIWISLDGESSERPADSPPAGPNAALVDQPRPPRQSVADALVRDHGAALFLLVQRAPNGSEEPVCSAFAVRSDLLATTAHCVMSLESARGSGAELAAVSNGSRRDRLALTDMWRHPGYRVEGQGPSADVGLVKISGTVSQPVRLATMQALSEVEEGDALFVYAFPSEVPNLGFPTAEVSQASAQRLSRFDGSEAEFAARHRVDLAPAQPGIGGGAIFDDGGLVVAIAARGYGVRADLLLGLLAGLER